MQRHTASFGSCAVLVARLGTGHNISHQTGKKFMKIGILAIAAAVLATTSAALAVEPDEANGAQGVVVTSFSIGLSEPNNVVPTLDGVPGAGVHN